MKIKKLLLIITISLTLVGCSSRKSITRVEETSTSAQTESVTIFNANKITIKESIVSVGKKYNLSSNGTSIGYVKGLPLNIVWDKFTLYDSNDNVIAVETEQKRILSGSYNRASIIKDENGATKGYIGEEIFNNLFNPFIKFDFYDENKNKIGLYKTKISVVFRKGEMIDDTGKVAYSFKEKFDVLRDVYELEVIDTSKISLVQSIFMVCIQDAINDSKKNKN